MTSDSSLTYYDDEPYVEKISLKNVDVDFIYQYVQKNYANYDRSLMHNNAHLTGPSTEFPHYGNFRLTFSMRTYGFDISTSPWQDQANIYYTPQNNKLKAINNYIDIQFHEAVYPIRVSIYEIYNPGYIIRIWVQDSDSESGQWFLLWNGSPQIVPPASRLFSPPLESCYFKTKMLRLEFKPSSWDYHTKLDAVMLIGTSKLILPRNPNESITSLLKRIECMHFHHKNEDVHNLTTDYKKVHLDLEHLQQNFDEYCIIHKSNLGHKKVSQVGNPCHKLLVRRRYSRRLLLKNDLYSVKCMNPIWNEIEESSRYSLSDLPDEIILKILVNLDLMTLCRLNQVNRRFYYLTQDSVLYKRLNVRNVCHMNTIYICNIFCYFTPRCKNLQQLDLSASKFPVSHFIKFLDDCGSQLTHLRLSRCSSVNDFALYNISKICKNLKQLDLEFCERIREKGFLYLQDLKDLEHLSIGYIYHVPIKAQTLCKILQKTPQMRNLNLELMTMRDLDAVAMELKKSCRNLEVLNLHLSSFSLSSQGVNALADCKNLRKVSLSTLHIFEDDSLDKLFSSCQLLEEVHLSHIDSYRNLNSLTQCINMKELHLYNVIFDTSSEYSVLFEECPKLEEFHLILCQIDKSLIDQWMERYPHVVIYFKIHTHISIYL